MKKNIKSRAIMLLGTASNAGKSILSAGICRLLTRKGYKVAPFKAQNMSLNSWVTSKGQEMGLAQAIQATACNLEPDARMNPVLLKPLGDMRSQIILNGKPFKILSYGEYIRLKPILWRTISAAYDELAQNADVMVLEGAGSPAEINLRSHDIVNMRMVHYADARAILVADIDRGGAFAALAGTMTLMNNRDRKRISALCLNKFRGDESLLSSAINKLQTMYDRKFIGIIPMLADHGIPDEDSVSLWNSKAGIFNEDMYLDIAIVRLPWISNTSDWEPLKHEPGTRIRFVDSASQLGKPDLLILPGSRNVPHALEWLISSGLFEAISKYAKSIEENGLGEIMGICAGLQILGKAIEDPDKVEGDGHYEGLNILPIETCLHTNKILSKKEARVLFPIMEFEQKCSGYEIHHGRIQSKAAACIKTDENEELGWCNNKGNIWGVWLHGIFNGHEFRRSYMDKLRKKRNLPPIIGETWDLNVQLDKLAEILEQKLDMEMLYSWL